MDDRHIRVDVTQKELDILNGDKEAIFDLFMITFFHDHIFEPDKTEKDEYSHIIKNTFIHDKDDSNMVPKFIICIDEKEGENILCAMKRT